LEGSPSILEFRIFVYRALYLRCREFFGKGKSSKSVEGENPLEEAFGYRKFMNLAHQ
jgi:hypothetical protein